MFDFPPLDNIICLSVMVTLFYMASLVWFYRWVSGFLITLAMQKSPNDPSVETDRLPCDNENFTVSLNLN